MKKPKRYCTVKQMASITRLSEYIIRKRLGEGIVPGAFKAERNGFVAVWHIPFESRFHFHRKTAGKPASAPLPPDPNQTTIFDLKGVQKRQKGKQR